MTGARGAVGSLSAMSVGFRADDTPVDATSVRDPSLSLDRRFAFGDWHTDGVKQLLGRESRAPLGWRWHSTGPHAWKKH